MNVKWTKRFWAFAGAAFVSFSASAAEAQSPAPIWTGLYIGAHGGGGWGETGDEGIELGGGLGGLHGGYQWQSGAFVLSYWSRKVMSPSAASRATVRKLNASNSG